MIDPALSLAFSIYNNKGVYALLLGSGISRSAQIPTGYEVIADLVKQIAHLKGADEDCEPDPWAWYERTYSRQPDYSELLAALAKSPEERSQLLRVYFEPNEEEREEGAKRPTAAHKAIAELVAAGYVRVIVTTNFDQLMEQALRDEGVNPTVISTPDAVAGALPLAHIRCCVIKVHGDYTDARIKNTEDELKTYETPTNRLLDQVFDEYGLVVCGWSADWDYALRAAVERCSTHRFTTYWTYRGKLSEAAQNLITLRRAEILQITDADSFFDKMKEQVQSLEGMAQSHPLSERVAVESLKRYLPEPRHRIRLEELVNEITERAYKDCAAVTQQTALDGVTLLDLLKRYEAAVRPLQLLVANGCYWGEEQQAKLWRRSLTRIANPEGTSDLSVAIQRYPALLLMYTGGIVSLAANRYGNFAAVTVEPVADVYNTPHSIVYWFVPDRVVDRRELNQAIGVNYHHPLSERLFQVLSDVLSVFIPERSSYSAYFYEFEYLWSLLYADDERDEGEDRFVVVGKYLRPYLDGRVRAIEQVKVDIANMGDNWPPLKAGLFGGESARVQEAQEYFTRYLDKNKIRLLFPR